MYTLRIIDQTIAGVEERRNIFIGNEYSVLMKLKSDSYRFEKALEEFYEVSDETIIGFVYANGLTHPIRDYNVVYIVGNEGQTIERIYGQYVKY